MKATEITLLDFLRKSLQFEIPIYQRTYSWTESQCRQLWDDIIRAGENNEIPAHFVGSIVYIQDGLFAVANPSSLLVVDGQQRLTTIHLIIAVLARHVENSEPVQGFSSNKLRNYYLLNREEEDENRYKLLLTQTDKQTLLSIINEKDLPVEHSLRLKENFDYFDQKVKSLKGNLVPLCKGLSKLVIVDISLDRSQDNPQLIFESMNSTGLDLSQADLIRNFILMGLKPEHQTQLYNEHWHPMEEEFGQVAYSSNFDGFMRHYLTLKTGEIPKLDRVYEEFKKHAQPKITSEGIDAILADIHKFAKHYCAMALGQEINSLLKSAFYDLRELKVDVVYPFLLELYDDYSNKVLTAEQLEQVTRLVESYVFRRAVCAIPTNSLNKTFATFSRSIKKEQYMESIAANFLLLPSYRRFPDNEEFRREIQIRDLYNFPRRSYWLRKFENHTRKEPVSIGEYTIEHILPQNENLSTKWQDALGPDWRQVQEKYLHTLGNLTLTGYNLELSDRPFTEKRDMEPGGLGKSPLRVNEGLGQVENWNEEEINKRADRMARQAAEVWSFPDLSKEKIDAYRGKTIKKTGEYSIQDYPYLAKDCFSRTLFELLRKEVLALDLCVREEILKHYIAYKAETNFVDVTVQADSLMLYINLPFLEIHDPKKLARDVTNIGSRGNGDVEVRLKNQDDIRYVMGMVREAFEKQMGGEE